MRKIYKYQLKITSCQTIKMPSQARLLTAQFQDDVLCVWAVVEDSSYPCLRQFAIYGTGEEISGVKNLGIYVATVQAHNGLVWHLFDYGEIDL